MNASAVPGGALERRDVSRLIAIGDIHGCAAALDALVQALRPQANDTIVTLGDVIDWGPDSRGVIERLIVLDEQSRLVPLMGNHEEMLFGAMPASAASAGPRASPRSPPRRCSVRSTAGHSR